MRSDTPLVVSFSGGKTSGFMSRFLQLKYPKREKVFAFANTGKEYEQTLEFVDRCDREWGLGVRWLEADVQPYGTATQHRVVDLKSASREGQPFEAVIAKYGIPNNAFKHCSRELKANVIRSYITRELGWTDYETAIGIRADEAGRINRAEALARDWIYPLTDDVRASRRSINDWWAVQPFTLELDEDQGNCDRCWKKSDRKLVKLIRQEPERLDWWELMETKYGRVRTERRPEAVADAVFYRGGRSAKDMRRLAERVGSGLFDEARLNETETPCLCS